MEARPVFLQLDKTITCHLIIVFAGLAIARYVKMRTGMSIRVVVKAAEKILTHQVINTQTHEKAYVETTVIDEELKQKIDLLNCVGH